MFCTFGVFLDTTSCCCTIMYEINNIINLRNTIVASLLMYSSLEFVSRETHERTLLGTLSLSVDHFVC